MGDKVDDISCSEAAEAVEGLSDACAASFAVRPSEAGSVLLAGGDLEQVLVDAAVGAWVWFPSTGKFRWSEGVSRLHGLQAGQFEGSFEHYLRLVHVDDRAAVAAAVDNALATGTEYRVEHRVASSGHEERWLTAMGRSSGSADRSVVRVAGIVFDSTERKRAEQSLREGEERIRAFAEGAVEGIAFGNAGKIVAANRAFATILGYEADELVGQEIEQFVAPEERSMVFEHMQTGYEAPYEHRAVRKDGTTVWVEARGREVMYRGTACRMTALRDIAERKRSEIALRERDEMIRALVESSRDWIWAIDVEGRHSYTNPAFENILGYSPSEIAGRDALDLLHPDDHAWVNEQFPQWVRAKTGWKDVLLRWRHQSGEYRYLESNAAPILDEDGELQGFRGMDRDITERIRFEEEKEELETQLLHAQKMEAVGRLAGGVAHDFNNLLTVILGNLDSALESIADRASGDEELIESLREAATSAERAGTLTAQLLAFSRRQVSRPETLSVNSQVSELERMLRRLLSENIELHVRLAPKIPPVKVDPGQFQQVVMNLVINARDAMPNGGSLTISTREVSDECMLGGAAGSTGEMSYVVVSVKDTGVGIDPDALDHIFEPFFTTKGIGEGTGLGLATVYGIVAQAGGHVEVESHQEQGTSFHVHLPVSTHAPMSSRPTGGLRRAVGGSEVILVCEDEPVVRRLIVRALSRVGYAVLEAENGAAAVRLATNHPQTIALLVTDVIMPEMNGHVLSERLRRTLPKLKTLFCSGYTADVISPHGVLATGVEFLAKPFKTEVLLHRVRDLLDTDS